MIQYCKQGLELLEPSTPYTVAWVTVPGVGTPGQFFLAFSISFCYHALNRLRGHEGMKAVGAVSPLRRGRLPVPRSIERGAAHGYIHRSDPDRYSDRWHLQPDYSDMQKEVTAGTLTSSAITSMYSKG